MFADLTFHQLFTIFWLIATAGIVTSGLLSLYSRHLPEFAQKLVFYGKYQFLIDKTEKKVWPRGCTSIFNWIDAFVKRLEIRKSCFQHFYIFSLMINCIVVALLWFSHSNLSMLSAANYLLLIAQFIQSIRRLYETFFVSIFSGNSEKFVCKCVTNFIFHSRQQNQHRALSVWIAFLYLTWIFYIRSSCF